MGKGIWFKQNLCSVLSEKCVPRTGTVQNFRFVFLFVSVGRATKLTIFFFVFFLLLRFEQINNKIVKQFSHFPRRRRRSRCCRRICSFLFFKSFWVILIKREEGGGGVAFVEMKVKRQGLCGETSQRPTSSYVYTKQPLFLFSTFFFNFSFSRFSLLFSPLL